MAQNPGQVHGSGLIVEDLISNDSKSSSLGGAGLGSDKVSNKSGGGSRRMATPADIKLSNCNAHNPKIMNNANMRTAGTTTRGLDGRFGNILDEVAKRSINDKPQNIFQAIATQRETRDTSN